MTPTGRWCGHGASVGRTQPAPRRADYAGPCWSGCGGGPRGVGEPVDGRPRRLAVGRAGPRPHLVGPQGAGARHRHHRRRSRACSRSPRTPSACSRSAPASPSRSTTGGFRLSRGSTVLADTVTKRCPGHRGRRRGRHLGEPPARAGHLALTARDHRRRAPVDGESVTLQRRRARHGTAQLPLRITFEPIDGRIRMDVSVARRLGASPSTSTGARRPPASRRPCPSATSRSGPTGSTRPSSSSRPSPGCSAPTSRSGRSGVARAVDLRQDGRIAIHVWSPRAVITVTDTPRRAPWQTRPHDRRPARRPAPQRVAMVTVHTSPLAQPGHR